MSNLRYLGPIVFYKNRRHTGGIRKERVVAIKTAIIGLGIMGQRMLEQMTLHPEFLVNTIWDPDSSACQSCLLYTSPSPRDTA